MLNIKPEYHHHIFRNKDRFSEDRVVRIMRRTKYRNGMRYTSASIDYITGVNIEKYLLNKRESNINEFYMNWGFEDE